MRELRGIAAAPGIAVGPIYKQRAHAVKLEVRRVGDPDGEWSRLTAALDGAAEQLEAVRERALNSTGADSAATTIVTNSGGPKDLLEAIRKMGMRIIEVGRDSPAHGICNLRQGSKSKVTLICPNC